jgi:uncharacterized protein YoxC
MNVLAILFGIVALAIVVLGAINLYLINLVRKLERELDEWEVPF